jgi:hypothetical protein
LLDRLEPCMDMVQLAIHLLKTIESQCSAHVVIIFELLYCVGRL